MTIPLIMNMILVAMVIARIPIMMLTMVMMMMPRMLMTIMNGTDTRSWLAKKPPLYSILAVLASQK